MFCLVIYDTRSDREKLHLKFKSFYTSQEKLFNNEKIFECRTWIMIIMTLDYTSYFKYGK